jgi:hypothetical protein
MICADDSGSAISMRVRLAFQYFSPCENSARNRLNGGLEEFGPAGKAEGYVLR